MTSQSGDDTQKPTAPAKIFLEDGTVLTGVSFGSHKSAEGEVRKDNNTLVLKKNSGCCRGAAKQYDGVMCWVVATRGNRDAGLVERMIVLSTQFCILLSFTGRFRHWNGRISRKHDGSFVQRTNLDLDYTHGGKLRCSRPNRQG